jgi:hypothetical protein
LQGTDEFDEFNSIEEDLLNTDEVIIIYDSNVSLFSSNLSNRTATTTTISRDQMHTLIELWKWRRRAPNWSSDAAIQ